MALDPTPSPHLPRGQTPQERIRTIIAQEAQRAYVTVGEILSLKRGDADVYHARQAAIVRLHQEFPGMGMTRLGNIFNRSRSAAGYALGRYTRRRDRNKNRKRKVSI